MSNFYSSYLRGCENIFDYHKVLKLKNDSEIFSFILKNYIKDKSPNDDFDNLHNLLYDNFIVECFLINNTLHFKFLFTISTIDDYIKFSILQTNLFSIEIEDEDERSFSYSDCKLLILNYLETNSLEEIYTKLNVAIYKSLAYNKPDDKFYELNDYNKIKLINFLNEQLTLLSRKGDVFFNNDIYDNLIIETKYVNALKRTVIFKFSYFKFSYEEEFTFKKTKHQSEIDALIFIIESGQYNFKDSKLREFIFSIHNCKNDIIFEFKDIITFTNLHVAIIFTFSITTLVDIFLFDKYKIGFFINALLLIYICILFLFYFERLYHSYSEKALYLKQFSTPEFNFYKKYKLFKNYMICIIIIFCIIYAFSTFQFYKELISLKEHY